MTEINNLLKCPNCHRKGTMEIIIRKKTAEAQCKACNELITSRVPYPKHRADHEGYQYHFKIGDVRPIWTHEDDSITVSQSEFEERKR